MGRRLSLAVDTEAPPDTSISTGIRPERWRPTRRGWTIRLSILAVMFLGLLLLINSVAEFQANRLAFAAIFAIVGLSMNMLMGYAGQISLGHQAFVGIGAFTSAFIVTTMELPFFMAIIGASLSGAVTALILGGIALRVRGLYLALVTLAYGAVAESTIFLFRPFTGGGAGLDAPRPGFATGDAAYAYLCLAVLGLVLFLDWRFTKSKAGRAVLAVRDSERVAGSMGINVTSYKLLAFVLSGLIAGLAGGLLAHQAITVVASPFNFFLALEFVLMTVVGGLGSRSGVVAGSVFFALLDKYAPEVMDKLAGIDVSLGLIAGLPAAIGLFLLLRGRLKPVVAIPIASVLGLLMGLLVSLSGVTLALGYVVGAGLAFVVFSALRHKVPVILAVVLGIVIGVLLIFGVDAGLDALRKVTETGKALLVPAIGAGLLIVTLIQFPGGIGQQIRPIVLWFSGHKFSLHEMHEGPAAAGGQDVRP